MAIQTLFEELIVDNPVSDVVAVAAAPIMIIRHMTLASKSDLFSMY
jgi:hypothetical protein